MYYCGNISIVMIIKYHSLFFNSQEDFFKRSVWSHGWLISSTRLYLQAVERFKNMEGMFCLNKKKYESSALFVSLFFSLKASLYLFPRILTDPAVSMRLLWSVALTSIDTSQTTKSHSFKDYSQWAAENERRRRRRRKMRKIIHLLSIALLLLYILPEYLKNFNIYHYI